MHHEFSIPIADLDAAGREYTFPVRAAWVRGALEGCDATTSGKDGSLELRVSKSGNDVVVHGHVKAELSAECARCLAPIRILIDQPVTALLVPAATARAEAAAAGEEDLANEDLDVLTYAGETVVLDDFLRDELVLEIPMIPLCSEDCPGIDAPSAHAPTNLSDGQPSIDPRLAPLLRLKTNHKKE
jgi:uncharacterized protein